MTRPKSSRGARSRSRPPGDREWVYESIVRSVPGVNTSRRVAVAVQFLAFEAAVLGFGWYHGLWKAALAGTAGVLVAVAGSLFMLRLSRGLKSGEGPDRYVDLLFGSSIELVLGLVSFTMLIVYAFVYDPQGAGPALVADLLGDPPPLAFTFVLLLVGWDVAYRIGVGWWASVTGLWRSVAMAESLSESARRRFTRLDAMTIGFASLQLVLVPILGGHPLVQIALLGHVFAVALVSGTSILLLNR
ncbi:MAG: hypothetical protein U5K70_01715 [Halodesulfurarchaeum sp.]|nr:hypothetical protein [Halodesulfurarchaeum sp.]